MADTKQATAETVCERCGKEIVQVLVGWVHYDSGNHACALYATPRTQPSQAELAPPRHAFEVRITIGADDWDYVLRTMGELAAHIREHGPECQLSSGGWGGCHSVNIQKRDITPDAYRDELEAWRIARLEGGR